MRYFIFLLLVPISILLAQGNGQGGGAGNGGGGGSGGGGSGTGGSTAPSTGSIPSAGNGVFNFGTGTTDNSTSGGGSSPNITTDSAGRLVWVTPLVTQTNKVRFALGTNVTLRWKFDQNVQVAPINLTLAISTDRRNWVNITTVPGGTTQFIWFTGNWDALTNGPLVTSTTYTMLVSDERGQSSLPQAGYLMPNMDLQFQFYSSGVPICVACNDAYRLAHGVCWLLMSLLGSVALSIALQG